MTTELTLTDTYRIAGDWLTRPALNIHSVGAVGPTSIRFMANHGDAATLVAAHDLLDTAEVHTQDYGGGKIIAIEGEYRMVHTSIHAVFTDSTDLDLIRSFPSADRNLLVALAGDTPENSPAGYFVAPDSAGETTLWRFDFERPEALITQREMDKLDPNLWPALVSGLTTTQPSTDIAQEAKR
jgi:hypothetical protein